MAPQQVIALLGTPDLVQWDGEPPDPQNDAEKLMEASDLKIRPAEDPPIAAPAT